MRRLLPRIEVETFCSEVVGHRDVPGLVIDLGPEGARLERPYLGGPTPRELLLEIEVPDVDEVIWARAEVRFDQVRQAPPGRGGPFGLVRTTGVHLTTAAARDLRMLRECVIELHRMRQPPPDLLEASCYARG